MQCQRCGHEIAHKPRFGNGKPYHAAHCYEMAYEQPLIEAAVRALISEFDLPKVTSALNAIRDRGSFDRWHDPDTGRTVVKPAPVEVPEAVRRLGLPLDTPGVVRRGIALTDEQILDEVSRHGFIGSREQLLKFVRDLGVAKP